MLNVDVSFEIHFKIPFDAFLMKTFAPAKAYSHHMFVFWVLSKAYIFTNPEKEQSLSYVGTTYY